MSKKAILSVLVVGLAYIYYRSQGKVVGKVISTKSGSVQGIVSLSRDGREYYEWLGIPYAQPPVGQLRFASPLPIEKWSGTKDASRYGSKCIQLEALTYRFVGSEDCLFLNIHVPKTEKPNVKLPVMVSVHGGGFNIGSSNDFHPDYFMDEDVVLVTINYRLGVFGFLTTGDASIRGNMGLKDQVLSLKWIKENIEAFGGDPDQITIFGESAGGASVHYLLLSPQTQGLFQGAISQSGVTTEPFGYDTTEGAKAFARKYARDVKCPAEDSTELAKCLRSRSTDELLEAAREDMRTEIITHPHKNGYLLRPTMEAVNDSETFLAEHPLKVIAEGRASRVPWMTGLVAEEGLLSSVAFYKNEKFLEEYEEKFESQIFETFGIPPPNSSKDVAKKIRDYYFPKEIQSTQQRIDQFTKLFSDANFNLQMSRTASLQKNFSPVYLYYYSKTGGPSLAPFLAGIKGNYPLILELSMTFVKNYLNEVLFGVFPKDYGVCHGDDLAMQFYMPYIFQVKKDSRHYKFSKDFVAFWVAFAKDPSTAKFRGVELPILKPKEKLQYLEITESPKIIPEPFEDRLKFLTSLNFHKR